MHSNELMRGLREGDARAFEELDRRYRARLTAFAARLLGSPHDAEDVVQQAMLRAVVGLPDESREIDLGGWLHVVVRNACLDLLRHRRATASAHGRLATAAVTGEDAHDAAQRREALAEVVDDVRSLPVRQQHALVLACVEGLPHTEVARRIDSTVPATKSLLVRARSNLARLAAARERSRRAVLALTAPVVKLAGAAGGGAVPVAALSVAAVGIPVVLTGAGRIVETHTISTSEPAPRPLEYGPFGVAPGAPLPAGLRLEEATVELPAGESAPQLRRLAVTCPEGHVQAGISTTADPALDRLSLSDRSSRRIGEVRRAVIVFRPRPQFSVARTVRLGVRCATPEYWRRVGSRYPAWAECDAISSEIRRLRRAGAPVPRGLLRAQRIDCADWGQVSTSPSSGST